MFQKFDDESSEIQLAAINNGASRMKNVVSGSDAGTKNSYSEG